MPLQQSFFRKQQNTAPSNTPFLETQDYPGRRPLPKAGLLNPLVGMFQRPGPSWAPARSGLKAKGDRTQRNFQMPRRVQTAEKLCLVHSPPPLKPSHTAARPAAFMGSKFQCSQQDGDIWAVLGEDSHNSQPSCNAAPPE